MLLFMRLVKCSACRNFHSARTYLILGSPFYEAISVTKYIRTFSLQSFVLEIMLCFILMILMYFKRLLYSIHTILYALLPS